MAQISSPSARKAAHLAERIVVANAYCIFSPISASKRASFKSWSSLADIYSISTPSTIASSTLLSSNGERQNSVFV
jgi:hypothetical protein